jgi:hypothetical protein
LGRVDLTVNERILAYRRYAEGHYARDGRPSRHLENLDAAIAAIRPPYEHLGGRGLRDRGA